jgi:hypothetical protein
MNSSDGDPVSLEGQPKEGRPKEDRPKEDRPSEGRPREGRWVGLTLEQRQVSLDTCDETPSQLSYPGILITHYDSEAKISEAWVPLGVDPSEADDEELIQQLRCALLWQADKQPNADAD